MSVWNLLIILVLEELGFAVFVRMQFHMGETPVLALGTMLCANANFGAS